MSFDEYLDRLDYKLDYWMDTMYWSDSFDTYKLFDLILSQAESENINITDKDTVDYDTVLYNLYRVTEKGLSWHSCKV